MAPEQCRGIDVDHRADVFALTAIAYRALTGRPAFSGPDQYVILYSIVNEQPARPSELFMLPADIELVLALGLAKEPAERFQSAGELSAAFGLALHNALGEELRARAWALLAKMPWGSAPKDREGEEAG
jgi:serine/threonine-protein kinase